VPVQRGLRLRVELGLSRLDAYTGTAHINGPCRRFRVSQPSKPPRPAPGARPLFRERGTRFLVHVDASDRIAAEIAAVEKFQLDNGQRNGLWCRSVRLPTANGCTKSNATLSIGVPPGFTTTKDTARTMEIRIMIAALVAVAAMGALAYKASDF
jgi:hypothetical protein